MAMNHEVQVITTSFSSDVGRGGQFTLSSIETGIKLQTEPLAWDASAEAVQSALLKLADVEDVQVSRSETATDYAYTVTFNKLALHFNCRCVPA